MTWETEQEDLSALEDLFDLLKEIEEDFECADISETRADFVTNLKEVQLKAARLEERISELLKGTDT